MLVVRTSIFHCRARKARIPSLIDPNDLPTNHVALKKTSVDFNHQAVASSEQQKEVSVSLADEIAHIRRVQSDPQAVVRLVKERPDAMGSFMDALAESPSTMDKFIDVFSENEKVVDHVQKIIQAFVGENKRSSNGAGLNGSGSEPKKTEKDRVPQVEVSSCSANNFQ